MTSQVEKLGNHDLVIASTMRRTSALLRLLAPWGVGELELAEAEAWAR